MPEEESMENRSLAIDEKMLPELRKLFAEREKLDEKIKSLLGMTNETRPAKKRLSRDQFRMLCGA